jgi:hypothetical protein
MSEQLIIKPFDWPCTLAECPSGLFVYDGDLGSELAIKTEYKTAEGRIEAYCTSSGEFFAGNCTNTEAEREALVVQPCYAVWVSDAG